LEPKDLESRRETRKFVEGDAEERMESKRTVSQVINNNPQGSRPRGRPRNRWWNCVQTDIKKYKINNWKER
jgi:hypothetical protein